MFLLLLKRGAPVTVKFKCFWQATASQFAFVRPRCVLEAKNFCLPSKFSGLPNGPVHHTSQPLRGGWPPIASPPLSGLAPRDRKKSLPFSARCVCFQSSWNISWGLPLSNNVLDELSITNTH